MNNRELLVCKMKQHISVLVPKKRGTGFLRCPWYHGRDDALSEAVGDYDACGLDGCLEIETGFSGQSAAIAEVMPRLSAHYECSWREVCQDEYWRREPINGENM